MDEQLKERAQKVAQWRNLRTRPTDVMIAEAAEVYRLLFGKTVECNGCNFYSFLNEINSKLIQEPLKIKIMANAKGQFKHNAASREIIRHTKTGTKLITPENLNEGDNFEWAAKNFSHLVQEAKTAKSESATEEKAAAPTTSKKKKKVAPAAAKPVESTTPAPAEITTEETTEAE